MKSVKRWTGLSCIMAFLLVFSILGTSCAMSYDSVVNGALGIQVSKIVEGEARKVRKPTPPTTRAPMAN